MSKNDYTATPVSSLALLPVFRPPLQNKYFSYHNKNYEKITTPQKYLPNQDNWKAFSLHSHITGLGLHTIEINLFDITDNQVRAGRSSGKLPPRLLRFPVSKVPNSPSFPAVSFAVVGLKKEEAKLSMLPYCQTQAVFTSGEQPGTKASMLQRQLSCFC